MSGSDFENHSKNPPTTNANTILASAPAPDIIIHTPSNYELTHELHQCPLCDRPNPFLLMYMPVREFSFRYFDICLYTCDTFCKCVYGANRDPINYDIKIKPHNHKFSVKHEILFDSDHLEIYDRTHQKGVW
jgi:hypothetical protein